MKQNSLMKFTLSIVCASVLAACGSSGGSDSTPSASVTPTPTPTPMPTPTPKPETPAVNASELIKNIATPASKVSGYLDAARNADTSAKALADAQAAAMAAKSAYDTAIKQLTKAEDIQAARDALEQARLNYVAVSEAARAAQNEAQRIAESLTPSVIGTRTFKRTESNLGGGPTNNTDITTTMNVELNPALDTVVVGVLTKDSTGAKTNELVYLEDFDFRMALAPATEAIASVYTTAGAGDTDAKKGKVNIAMGNGNYTGVMKLRTGKNAANEAGKLYLHERSVNATGKVIDAVTGEASETGRTDSVLWKLAGVADNKMEINALVVNPDQNKNISKKGLAILPYIHTDAKTYIGAKVKEGTKTLGFANQLNTKEFSDGQDMIPAAGALNALYPTSGLEGVTATSGIANATAKTLGVITPFFKDKDAVKSDEAKPEANATGRAPFDLIDDSKTRDSGIGAGLVYTYQEGRTNYITEGNNQITTNVRKIAGSEVNEKAPHLVTDNEAVNKAEDESYDRQYIRDVRGTVAEVYGARTFVERPTNLATQNNNSLRDDPNFNNLPLEDKRLKFVQYGRVTSQLSGVGYGDLRDGALPKTKIAGYGQQGAAGTEDQYFYRGNQAITAEQLSALKSEHNASFLTYDGHAVTYGMNHNFGRDDGYGNAIGAAYALQSGTHMTATVNLDTNQVNGRLFNKWRKQELVDGEQKWTGKVQENLVTFNGDIKGNGSIVGTSTYLKAASDAARTGNFHATLYGAGAEELGGSVASTVKTGSQAWGATFGGVFQGASQIDPSVDRWNDGTNIVNP